MACGDLAARGFGASASRFRVLRVLDLWTHRVLASCLGLGTWLLVNQGPPCFRIISGEFSPVWVFDTEGVRGSVCHGEVGDRKRDPRRRD